MAIVRCPMCNQQFDSEQCQTMPFCCERCRQLDLGHWLDERYSVTVERDPDDIEEDGI